MSERDERGWPTVTICGSMRFFERGLDVRFADVIRADYRDTINWRTEAR